MKMNFLTEGISPILYHLTSLHGAGQIVAQDRFRLSASFSNSSEQETGSAKQFFLSTTRSKTGGYTLRNAGNQSAVIVLDGNKLRQRYSGGPVQYYSRGMINIDNQLDELEDRIYHSEPYIKNASSYITEIHALIHEHSMNVHGRKSIAMIKRAGIDLFLYDDERAFVLQDKRRAKPLKFFTIPRAVPEEPYPRVDRDATRKQERRRQRQRTGKDSRLSYDLDRWIELMVRPVEQYQALHYDKKNLLRGLSFGINNEIGTLSADLHNAKNDPKKIAPMARLMQRHNLRTPQDILNFIKKRWEPNLL